jgi:hypothetical protein
MTVGKKRTRGRYLHKYAFPRYDNISTSDTICQMRPLWEPCFSESYYKQ